MLLFRKQEVKIAAYHWLIDRDENGDFRSTFTPLASLFDWSVNTLEEVATEWGCTAYSSGHMTSVGPHFFNPADGRHCVIGIPPYMDVRGYSTFPSTVIGEEYMGG